MWMGPSSSKHILKNRGQKIQMCFLHPSDTSIVRIDSFKKDRSNQKYAYYKKLIEKSEFSNEDKEKHLCKLAWCERRFTLQFLLYRYKIVYARDRFQNSKIFI